MTNGDHVVVTGDDVRLRAGPSTSSAVVMTCAKGTTAVVLDTEGSWTKIRLDGPAATSGYMASQYLAPADYCAGVTVDDVVAMFPGTPRANIAANLPFVCDGLRGCGLDDRQMVLMALGTIRAETAGFVPISEGQSKYNTPPVGPPFGLYDPGTTIGQSLGNTEPGDGARFKGRGYVQLTGRANYTRIGPEVSADLVGNPDNANDQAIAGRILACFLKNAEAKIRAALAANDLATARKLVNGGTHGLDAFEDAYNMGLQSLPS